MGVYRRGGKLWLRVRDSEGEWRNISTGYSVGEEALANEMLARILDGIKSEPTSSPSDTMTVRAWAQLWIIERRKADVDWKNDESRLRHHVLPTIGHMPITDVRTRHIVDVIKRLRFPDDPAKRLAQRTVYNCYSVISAMFRDAKLGDVIEQSPCVLTDVQLGPLVDSDPEWRADAVFDREEAETMISDERIPFDRRLYYAFGLLAGMRPGEIAALRVRHYDSSAKPLRKLTIAFAHNTRKNTTRGTKTGAVRVIPAHATLAAMISEWLLHGYEAMTGKKPEPDDLLLPLPPAAAERRRTREGEAIRTGDFAGKRWREVDLPMLGWRSRELYATKSTFITLAIEDGARRDVIRDRITHTKPDRDAFDGYDRGPHWIETCAELSKLRLARKTAADSEQRAVSGAAASHETRYSARYSPGNPALLQDKKVEAAGVEGETNATPRDGISRDGVMLRVVDSLSRDVACSPDRSESLQQSSEQAGLGDAVGAELEAARRVWTEQRDVRALRRALTRVLLALDESESDGA